MPIKVDEEQADKIEIIGQLWVCDIPDCAYDIVNASFNSGILIADTVQQHRVVLSPNSRWLFVSAPGKQNEIDFN